MAPVIPIALPLGFHEWTPWMQAGVLGVLTFVQEDIPAVSAALLVAAGSLAWPAGVLGVFLGIWLGDALLYLAARGLGRPMLERAWVRRWVDPAVVARSERWFGERGDWLLWTSRFVPGTRLPTYLAAGFLRVPLARFLRVTGLAVAVWTLILFGLAAWVGPALADGARAWKEWGASGGVAFWLLAGGAGVVGLRVLGGRMARVSGSRSGWRRAGDLWRRWTRWEFWPPWLFYAPVAVFYAGLALRHRGLLLPTAANPGMFSGGVVGESKLATLRELQASSPGFTAAAWSVDGATPEERLASFDAICAREGVAFPLVLKPDVGQRGAGVKLVRTRGQAEAYLALMTAPVLLQRYAPGPLEAGVFYYRFPHEARGRILAITEKIFPVVTGDGASTVAELIAMDDRARCMAGVYLARLGERAGDILAAGETLRLVEAGNHAQGCIFRDGADLWSAALEERIDEISRRLDGFFVGRYDLRFASVDDLRAGRNFAIVELNGAAAEATSLYDARHTLRDAYRLLFRQWSIVVSIGAANRASGARPMSVPEFWRAWRRASRWIAGYPGAD